MTTENNLLKTLLEWYEISGRKLPWRETTNPYAIVVSEFMLQQTQVSRVIEKYTAWLNVFPDWETLAQAPRQEVLKMWSGLGYNSRAIRLQTLAKYIHEECAGELPEEEKELQKLPGVGPYTAGAIRAFAYDKSGAFIDVNVERILKRTLYKPTIIPNREQLLIHLREWQKTESPRNIGNALMDLGSTYCTARNPNCAECPVNKHCVSKGERLEEHKIRKKKQQKPFKNSNRWIRGQIIKQLTQGPKDKKTLIEIHEDKEKVLAAIDQLKEEKLIEGKDVFSIREE